MNEKEIMDLINSIDNDLVDEKIDDLLNERGESVSMDRIKEKAMNKITEKQVKKSKINKKTVIAAAIAATLTFSSVYAGEISQAIQSFFNKSMIYSTVVDGDAYYLPQEVKLNDKFTLLNVSVSNGCLDISVKPYEKLADKETESLNVSVTPMDDKGIRYKVGGYGYNAEDGVMQFSFMNETENNYSINPFKDFIFSIDGSSYDISLVKAESIKTAGNLSVGKSEINTEAKVDTGKEISINKNKTTDLIANVAGMKEAKDGKTNIQLVAGFNDKDLKLRALGEPDLGEFLHEFKNYENGIIGSSSGSTTKPITAYDKDNNAYTLHEPKNAVGRPITIFEINADQDTDLTVKLPAVCAGYEKSVAEISLNIPKEGEASVNKELDFIIQKANVKSIKRISEDTAVVEFELNTGSDESVYIMDMGAYSEDVIKAVTTIKGNTATMTMTFDKDTENIDFKFSWPNYVIKGNWLIELGTVE